MAAGLSLNESQLNDFEIFFENFVKKNKLKLLNSIEKIIKIDEVLTLNGINETFMKNIDKISPYGIGNPKPKFLFHDVQIIKPKLIGETKKHLSFFIKDQTNKTLKAVIFNASNNLLGSSILANYKKNFFTFVGSVNKSIWKNKIYFEIIIEDGVLGKVII